jgi:hypothetical protein
MSSTVEARIWLTGFPLLAACAATSCSTTANATADTRAIDRFVKEGYQRFESPALPNLLDLQGIIVAIVSTGFSSTRLIQGVGACNSDLRRATIDEQLDSSDVAGVVGGEKRHRLGDFVCSAGATEWR